MSKDERPFLVLLGRQKAFHGDRVCSFLFPKWYRGVLEHVKEKAGCYDEWMVHWDNGESEYAPPKDLELIKGENE